MPQYVKGNGVFDNQNGDRYEYKHRLVFKINKKLWIKTCPVSVSGMINAVLIH